VHAIYDTGATVTPANHQSPSTSTDLQLQEVDIGGSLLINAESLEDAVEIAQQAPHMALGGTTIVRPCMALTT